MEQNLVVGIGEVLWDMLPEGKKLGGAPCNFVYHIGQFGLNSCAVSAIGFDELGAEAVAAMEQKGVNFMLERVDYPTGTVNVTLNGEGVPQYDIKRNVAWDNIPYTAGLEEMARHTSAVCFGSLAQRSEVSRKTITRFVDAVAANGRNPLLVFDINLRQNFYTESIIFDSMNRCNVLKINDEELIEVGRLLGKAQSSESDLCRLIMSRFKIKTLILTCGANGSYVYCDKNVSYLPTPQVNVADTVGAGDSFTAAFVASLLKGNSVEQSHRRAVEVSAYVCSRHGAMPELPDELASC